MNLNEMQWKSMGWIYHNQYRENVESSCTEGNKLLDSIKCGAFLTA